MRLPRRAPREVYRLYEENEFLGAAAPSEEDGEARPARPLTGMAGRAAAVAMLAGSVGAVGVLLVRHTGASPQRRAPMARTRAAMTARIRAPTKPRLSLLASTPVRRGRRRRAHLSPHGTSPAPVARTPLEQATGGPVQRELAYRQPAVALPSTDRPHAEFGFEH